MESVDATLLVAATLRTTIWVVGVMWAVTNKRLLPFILTLSGVFTSSIYGLDNANIYHSQWLFKSAVLLSAPQVVFIIGSIVLSAVIPHDRRRWTW